MTVTCAATTAVGLAFAALLKPLPALAGPRPDLTGRERIGIASFYARRFAGRTMANGAPMNPRANNAASRTLPLGTTAKVTNLQTGRSAIVRIEDRGPYVRGRIVDLSPRTARKIGLTRRQGIARVAVAPITIPLPDGRVKLGAGARRSGGLRSACGGRKMRCGALRAREALAPRAGRRAIGAGLARAASG